MRSLQEKVAQSIDSTVKKKRTKKALRKIMKSKNKVLFDVTDKEMSYHNEHRKRVKKAVNIGKRTLAPSFQKHRSYIE